ncbi:MAG: universal stress protein [Betaproteobacteria bacterium]|nr:universal stress protein [Betaproteobacteria bacterium]
MFKHLLVPTDGTELSDKALDKAVEFARECGARITFFYARPDYPVSFYGEGALIDPLTPERFSEMTAEQAQTILARASERASAAQVPWDRDTAVSDVPFQAIIDAATTHGCDLIFMASHGRRGLSGLLLGSETNKVLTHSTIPVLVFR